MLDVGGDADTPDGNSSGDLGVIGDADDVGDTDDTGDIGTNVVAAVGIAGTETVGTGAMLVTGVVAGLGRVA